MHQCDMLTIVIPLYNRATLITRLLDSIAAQTENGVKVIVVDNASTDDSYDTVAGWIKDYSGAIHFRLLTESKPGAAAARNCGLEAVDTEHVCFYDSDDTVRPDFVKSIMSAFRSSDADMVLFSRVVHDFNGKQHIIRPSSRNIFRNHILHSVLATQSYAATTALIRRAGGWNERALIWDDWELGIRLLMNYHINITHASKLPIADVYLQKESLTGSDFISRADKIDDALEIAEDLLADNRYGLSLIEIVRARISARIRLEGGTEQARTLRSKIKCHGIIRRAILSGVYLHTIMLRRGSATWAAPMMRLCSKKQASSLQ